MLFFIRIRACARVFLNCSGERASKHLMRSCRRAHWRLPCWLNSTCGQASNQLLLVGLESTILIRKLSAQYTGSPRFIPRAPRRGFKRCVRRIAATRSPCASGLDPLGRALGQFRGGRDTQLVFYVLEVGFDRLDAPRHGSRDLTRGPATTNQPEYLQFAVAERIHRRARPERSPGDILLGQSP